MSEKNERRILVGCAGWSLSSAVAPQFQTEGSHLQRYAVVLPAVEINSAFYRPHRAETYMRWRDSVPDDFRFSVKMPRTISHDRRLRDSAELLDTFLAEAGNLGEKLGCLLLQLPPSLVLDIDQASAFFAMLRKRTGVAVACEPRHASWFTRRAAELMQHYAISFVCADPMPVPDVSVPELSGMVYIRLHGSPEIYRSSYDEDFLDALAKWIEARDEVEQVWCVFDNTANGQAVPNALRLMQMLQLRHGDDT